MSDVPTSRVMAYGCSMSVSSPVLAAGVDQPVFGDVGVAYCLHPRDTRVFDASLEQVSEAALQFQIVLYRNLAADLAYLRDLAVLGLEDRIEATLDGKPRKPDRVVRSGSPS